jgi:hypothetical protein
MPFIAQATNKVKNQLLFIFNPIFKKMSIKILFASLLVACTLLNTGCKKDDPAATAPEAKTFTFDVECAHRTNTTPNAKCFIDFDGGQAYTIQEAPAHAAEIDAIWVYYGYDTQFYLYAPNYSSLIATGSNAFDAGSLGMGSWSVRKGCLLEDAAGMGKGEITGVKTVPELKTLIDAHLNNVSLNFMPFDGTSQTFARVYVFETSGKKRGAFVVNSNSTDSNGGHANITVKIEP